MFIFTGILNCIVAVTFQTDVDLEGPEPGVRRVAWFAVSLVKVNLRKSMLAGWKLED